MHLMTCRTRQTRPALRTRFNIAYSEHYDYDGVYSTETLTPDPMGGALSSLLDNGMHAPVLDADTRVTVTTSRGRSTVEFAQWGKRTGWLFRLHINGLLDSGLIYGWSVARDRLGLRRRVALKFPFEVIAVPSRSPRHFHLLCQTQVDWAEARDLANRLGGAGLADAKHARISSQGDFLYVQQADTSHDAV